MDNMNEDKKECCGGHGEMGGHHGMMGHKPCVKVMLGVFVAVLTIFVGFKAYNTYLESKYIGADQIAQNNITVSATGEAFAVADTAQISVSVVEENKDLTMAQKLHTEKINKVIKFIKDSGVEDKYIKTSNYSVYPVYDYNYRSDKAPVIVGYKVEQSLSVKIKKVEDAGKILAGVVENGANQVGGINFVIDDEDAIKRDARKKAIDEAKIKAEQIASDLGVKLVRIVSFNEDGYQPYYPMYETAMKADGFGGAAAPSPEIPVGENKVTVSVSITYEIR